MKVKDHLILASIAAGAWGFFYLLGIPSNYFQDWSFSELILLSMVTCFGAVPLIAFITIVLLNRDYFKTGIWMAFYGSVLLAALDFVFCGIVQGYGLHIFISHWYLSIAYGYVWIIMPLVGAALKKFRKTLLEEKTV